MSPEQTKAGAREKPQPGDGCQGGDRGAEGEGPEVSEGRSRPPQLTKSLSTRDTKGGTFYAVVTRCG